MSKKQIAQNSIYLENKIAVIAGGSTKSGRMIAELLAEKKMRIVIADINLINADVVAQEITAKYETDAAAIACDGHSVKKVLTSLKSLDGDWGKVYIWINNMAFADQVSGSDKHQVRIIIDKLKEFFFGAREIADYMNSLKIEGLIVNIFSAKESLTVKKLSDPEVIGKLIREETKALSKDIGLFGIRVLTFIPAEFHYHNKRKDYEPGGEQPDPADVAKIVIHHAATSNETMNGKVFTVNGKEILIDTLGRP